MTHAPHDANHLTGCLPKSSWPGAKPSKLRRVSGQVASRAYHANWPSLNETNESVHAGGCYCCPLDLLKRHASRTLNFIGRLLSRAAARLVSHCWSDLTLINTPWTRFVNASSLQPRIDTALG